MGVPETRPLLAAAAVCVVAACAHPAPISQAPSDARPYLDAAIGAARWLESVRVETLDGLVWPVAPGTGDDRVDFSLYSGTPGVILFLLELHRATGEARYLADATRGADALVAAIQRQADRSVTGLWTGLEGQMFVLAEVHRAGGEPRFRDSAVASLERTRARMRGARAAGEELGSTWDATTDIIRGAAGSGCALLYAHREELAPDLLADARAIGDWLLTQAIEVPLADGSDGPGLTWAMDPSFPRRMPNFSHGTAGVAYFLVELQAALGPNAAEGRYAAAARRGAATLLSIADRAEGGLRIFHHQPGGEDLMYLGWCHGPVGTARLFHALDRDDAEGEWRHWVARSAADLRGSGIPELRLPGLWNNVGPCCGTAGVGEFMLATADDETAPEHLAFARRIADDLIDRADVLEFANGHRGLRWIHAEHRTRPELLHAQTGYMQGASGVGLYLLRLDAMESGRAFGIRFPDDPFSPRG